MAQSDKIMAFKRCVIYIMCLISRKKILETNHFMSINKFKYMDTVFFFICKFFKKATSIIIYNSYAYRSRKLPFSL